MKKIITLLAIAAALSSGGVGLAAQGGRQGQRAGAGGEDGSVSPAEIQRMFDAYALMQAQEQLKISEDQFSQFLTRYKALQDVRRRNLQERTRLVNEMRRLLNRGQAAETELKERLNALQELETRLPADVKKAYDAIDQVLDLQQQAKFRVFEENMERRKLELVTRARQANRQKPQ
jgi:Spy/CpxP family protein refolding chaperone